MLELLSRSCLWRAASFCCPLGRCKTTKNLKMLSMEEFCDWTAMDKPYLRETNSDFIFTKLFLRPLFTDSGPLHDCQFWLPCEHGWDSWKMMLCVCQEHNGSIHSITCLIRRENLDRKSGCDTIPIQLRKLYHICNQSQSKQVWIEDTIRLHRYLLGMSLHHSVHPRKELQGYSHVQHNHSYKKAQGFQNFSLSRCRSSKFTSHGSHGMTRLEAFIAESIPEDTMPFECWAWGLFRVFHRSGIDLSRYPSSLDRYKYFHRARLYVIKANSY